MAPNPLHDVIKDLGISRPILLMGIAGFMDAGSAGRLATGYLRDLLESRVVARIDIDSYFDYRARRPKTEFMSDHYESIEMPEIVVRQFTDDTNTSFLMLTGPEPDMGWRVIADAICDLVDLWDVRLVVGMQGVPFPAPHTRPVQVTAHGNNPDLLHGRRPWVGDIEVPGSLNALVELMLSERDRDMLTLIGHVPHYLTTSEYHRASVRLLEETSAITGLVLPLDDLRDLANETDQEISAQVSSDSDNVEVVRQLENQFDNFMAARGVQGVEDVTASVADLPSGDEIAEQVERFLAEINSKEGDQ